ncbi:hypothetical protein ITP53_29990 [Nonomuraea sp. K274]|uniref:Uncharacterized protein n=1 Tax=Nonomuraea cypriaca TaxID=1187855 RepID=A0A931ADG6_9ACTN|nr:hypothetical protein [Nonomuraea cypriaca]MBF8189883.1 hypothetical protein [Nonomuraea cypriaca]
MLSVGRGAGFIVLEVIDPGVAGPERRLHARVPDITAESGRDLGLVEAYSKDWGGHTTEAGPRVVWAVLACATE